MGKYQESYQKLIVWQKLCELRRAVFLSSEKFNRPGNYRLVEQMRAAARSAKQNFAEGYKKNSLGHFINFCHISRGSLEELNEDINDCFEDKIISQEEYGILSSKSRLAMYFLDKYLISLYKIKKQEKWIKK